MMLSQPQLLQPSWPYYNIIDSSLDESCPYGVDMDFHMGECEFSSSVTTTEDSSDVSSIPYLSIMYPDELLNLPVYGDDDVQVMFPLEIDSLNLEELMDHTSNDQFLNDEIDDVSQWMEGSECGLPSQLRQYSVEEEDEESLCLSMKSSDASVDLTSVDVNSVQPSVVFPREDMEIDNQLIIPHLLKAYGDAVENEQAELAEVILKHLREKVSPAGATMERLAYYFFQSLDKQHDYLKQESSKNYEAAFRAFYQIFPYGRFAHFTANLAILESIPDDAETIHIIDFDMGEGVQWPPLIEVMECRREVRLTSIKWKKDCSSVPLHWNFEETKRRLYDHAQSLGLKLKVEEMDMEELVSEIKKMKRRVRGKEWLAFNCMVGLPHMGRGGRSRKNIMEFLNVAKDLITNSSCSSNSNLGILTFGDGDGVEERMNNCCGFGSFFDKYLLHFHALFESMEWHFPPHLTEAKIAMECLFMAPYASSLACFRKWQETREGCAFQLGFGLEGCRFSRENLLQAKEMVREGESLSGVRVEGENENEMVLEWRGTPLVRVSTWG